MAVEPIIETASDQESTAAIAPALVVDLDGTLVKTDLLLESLLVLLKRNPLRLFLLPFWLLQGKAYFKQQVARRVVVDASGLPYRAELLDYLAFERAQGRMLVLATASDMRVAQQVAEHLGLFDLVLASDGITNLSGQAKRDRLVREFGERGFDYAANARCDLAVWSSARKAIAVNPSHLVAAHIAPQVDRVFTDRRRDLLDYLRPLRVTHWLKNLLIFVPLFAAHRVFEVPLWEKAILAFLAFGCCASAGYLINDLFDLPSDRHHPHKRLRPFAAGDLPIAYALAVIPVLIALGATIALFVAPLFLGVLALYVALTNAYSLYVRKVVLLDVIFLAGLYTMRLMAGSASIDVWPSQWLLAFSTFLFFSLALVKRYGELVIMRTADGDHAKARAYELSDGELLASMGIASGHAAILVLALYINSPVAQHLYGRYELMWFLCPLLLYWISHVWLSAHRGKMPDDPLVFATHDETSRILIVLMLVTIVLAL